MSSMSSMSSNSIVSPSNTPTPIVAPQPLLPPAGQTQLAQLAERFFKDCETPPLSGLISSLQSLNLNPPPRLGSRPFTLLPRQCRQKIISRAPTTPFSPGPSSQLSIPRLVTSQTEFLTYRPLPDQAPFIQKRDEKTKKRSSQELNEETERTDTDRRTWAPKKTRIREIDKLNAGIATLSLQD